MAGPSPLAGLLAAEGCAPLAGRLSAEALRALPVDGWEVVDRAGLDRMLTRPEFVRWKIRLAIEKGLLAPARVPAPPLPEDVPATVRIVYKGFVFLQACRWLREPPGSAAPFSRDFAAAWCRVTPWQARESIRWLRSRGFLRVGDRIELGGGHWAYLYGLGLEGDE